ncbi:ABC transporter ATP-binding protein [Alkalilimnicola sp. S0819]|uniref:ABC transporter ATP-binding protein n=1 Tax=Alkalilimnicola sp. S0819 TaxID=2613922 RepID=UPI0012627D13|nr:ABC transporter ATP-binding protein [Alkalilimnicola sp. S0819]KAB7624174.1 ABC transporter ATP-binding protein [Alkalilimnicola sp. S0819]MPQ16427.1 ATP-binding cassette domain-containing protein [Alkalilimnicola sp. S0819]
MQPTAAQPLIRIQGLSKHYPGAAQPSLREVSLSVPEGSIFGLLGPNGAGKTTLLSVLTGLVRKDAGLVEVAGLDLDHAVREIRELCGVVPQELAFYPMLSVAENLRIYADVLGLGGARRRARIERVVEIGGLAGHMDKRAEALSGGLKRRLNLAIGLLNEPKLILLDEPTVGIDPQSRAFILDSIRALREAGATVIYTSHYMEEVQRLCDQLAIIDEGRILLQGELEALLSSQSDRLTLSFDRPLSDRALAGLMLNGLTPRRHEHGLELEGLAAAQLDLAALLAALQAQGVTVRSVRYGVRDLEELFLNVSGRRLRD